MAKDPLSSTTLTKSMALLSELADAGAPLTLTDLIRRTGLPKSTTHRILSILDNERLAQFDPDSRTYRIGYRFMSLAFTMWQNLDLRRAAIDEMRRLSEESRENTHLAVLDGPEIVYIDRVEAHPVTRLKSAVGNRASVHCTALGKAIMAFLPPKRHEEIMRSVTFDRVADGTITDPKAYRADLETVRQRGFAVAVREHQSDVTGVAAPIRDFRNEVVGAVAISIPLFRTDDDRLAAWGPRVIEATRTISRNLGWAG